MKEIFSSTNVHPECVFLVGVIAAVILRFSLVLKKTKETIWYDSIVKQNKCLERMFSSF